MTRTTVGAMALWLLAVAPVWAQDAEGCKDYPMFTRFPNMHIAECQSSQFDVRAFPVGPPIADLQTKPVEVEGKVQWISYELNEGSTPPSGLQIMRNFQNAAKTTSARPRRTCGCRRSARKR